VELCRCDVVELQLMKQLPLTIKITDKYNGEEKSRMHRSFRDAAACQKLSDFNLELPTSGELADMCSYDKTCLR